MSNEIKNTLFRFVSMRAPELTTEHDNSPGFITQPVAANGIFNDKINDKPEEMSKSERLLDTASNYIPLTADQIKKLNPPLYDFSVWLAKNKSSVSPTEIAAEAENVPTLSEELLPESEETHLQLVWQNLYYQVITQKDFYAKEMLMQLLLANHVVLSFPKITKVVLKAKVVLPKKLFVEGAADTEPMPTMLRGLGTIPSLASPFMQKMERVAVLQENNLALKKLQQELYQAEKIYQKKRDAEYESKLKLYQEDIKPLLDEYNEDVETARQQWCTVRDLNVPFDPNDPCNQPPAVPQPVIPEFTFVFTEEMNEDFLSGVISQGSLAVLNALKKFSEPESLASKGTQLFSRGLAEMIINPDLDSYNGTQIAVSQIIEHNNNTISQNTSQNTNTTVVVGGTTIAVNENPSGLSPFEFEVIARDKGIDNIVKVLTLNIGIPDESWKINSIHYKLTRYDDTFVTGSSGLVVNTARVATFFSLDMGEIHEDFKYLSAVVQFDNREEMSLTVDGFTIADTHYGYLAQNKLGLGNNNNPGSSVNPDNTFIPSGFGVKQLGIADYNKVEQSIQGYVEGEVAHIENVMAREYKEKATRRLRKSEITETTSAETEREQLTDTSSTDRFEMQSEVAKVIANSKDFSGFASVQGSYGKAITFQTGANLATHNSKEESTSQAMTSAKEVTERALDRIVNKVKEERIVKIVEEFEENNSHGFDNRKGDKHVVGVYRWVDKVFKNQILNYGKRLMFEFMVPEPAKLHKLAMEKLVTDQTVMTLEKPDDPRKVTNANKLENYFQMTETNLKYWTGRYNVEFEPMPSQEIVIGKSFSYKAEEVIGNNYERASDSYEVEIPEGYKTYKAKVESNDSNDSGISGFVRAKAIVGNKQVGTTEVEINEFHGKIPVSYCQLGFLSSSINFSIRCKLTLEAKTKWQQQTFNAIIKAYEEALAAYNEQLAEKQALGVQILGTNPGFYRDIENTILRKNCISYLIDQNVDAKRTYGKDFHRINGTGSKQTFENTELLLGADLDDYAAFVKFIEQAFEWDIMSYNFYPYYWANRQKWVEMYQYDQTHDHIFKAFMQSGMARVIVTVRPGFEEAVRYYMQTGQIWNGGEVPVIEDELYLSIVDELRLPEGEKVGKAWWTRIPTSMTILQAQSIGLNVTKALPFNDDLTDFEDPESVPQSSEIALNHAQVGGSSTGTARLMGTIFGNNSISSKIMLKRVDGFIQDITYCDTPGNWELNNLPAGRYELLLDVENDFPADTYQVIEGSKELMVELQDDQTVEINLAVALL